MWPADIVVSNTVDHAFVACDKNGAGLVFIRHMSIDPNGRRGGYKIADLLLDGTPYTPTGTVVPHPHAVAPVKAVSSFLIDCSRGTIPGYSVVGMQGRNLDIDAPGGYPATVWTGGGLYQFLSTARPLQIRSTSALDTAAGTGAQAVLVDVLDVGYNPSTIQFSLNGTTPVALGTWLRVNSVVALRLTGTPGSNQGELIVETADLPLVRVAHMAPRAGRAQQAVYSVPAGHSAFASLVRAHMYRTAVAGANAQLEIMQYTPGRCGLQRYGMAVTMNGNQVDSTLPPFAAMAPEKTDIEIQCTHVSNDNTQVFAAIQLVVVNNMTAGVEIGDVDVASALLLEAGDAVVLLEAGDEYIKLESYP